jgi:membrane-associated phospholipid phosphatase
MRARAPLIAIMVLVTADVLLDGPLRHLDHIVHAFCDEHVRGAVLVAVTVLTKLGQRGILVAVMVPLVVIAAVRRRSPRVAVTSVLVVGGLSLLQDVLKAAVPRTYPVSDVDVLFTRGDAYPSGHTLNAFVLVWAVTELLVAAFPGALRVLPPRRRRNSALLTGAVAAAALTVADQHWLTDCLFSVALGPILLHLVVAMNPFAERNRERPRSSAEE